MPSFFDNRHIGNIILEEAFKSEDTVITGEEGIKHRAIAQATLQRAEAVNRNKRAYRGRDLRKEIDGSRVQELIKAGSLKGECGHPLSDSLVRQQTIDPKFVCVKYLKVWMDKDLVKGHFKGTNNAYGDAVDADLRDGEKLAFSLRALGNIVQENGKAVVDNLRIITWDNIIYPSHPEAYTDKIISESSGSPIIVPRQTHLAKLTNKILTEAANDYYDSTGKRITRESQIKMIDSMNENGCIIHIKGRDAYHALNQLQRESASIGTILETFEGFANDIRVVNNRIKLTTAFGETFFMPLDQYADNLISEYAYSM